jgi:uncharacterized membrane protein
MRNYLVRLDAALANVPAAERTQIIEGIQEHASASLAELNDPTEADVRNVLDRLGDPETIAPTPVSASASQTPSVTAPRPRCSGSVPRSVSLTSS